MIKVLNALRKTGLKAGLAVLPSLLAIMFATTCALAPAAHAAPARSLVYCTESGPEGLDPGMWDSTSTHNATLQMFQGLLRFERGSTKLEPSLATHWEISPDARSFVFHLRQGVHFHHTSYFTPTRDFNADDVMFTFGRFLQPQHPFNLAFPVSFVYPQNLGLAETIASMEKVDQYTVRFTLKESNVAFLSYFAMSFSGIHSAEYGAQLLRQGLARRINSYPVGTGPYRFVSYKKDDVLRMEANPDYWRKPQLTSKLIFAIAADPNVRVNKLLVGECQVLAAVRDIDIPVLESRPNIAMLKIPGLNISYLSFNMKHKATSNRLVREALDIAVDRESVFKSMFPRGDAVQAVNPFPPMVLGYNDALKNEYNPKRAKELLAKAGYADGLELTLWALPVVRPTNPNGQLLAQLIQQDWARIGVKAVIKTYEWGEYLNRARHGEHDVYMSGWASDSGDPDDFMTPTLTSAANGPDCYKFCNAEVDKLVSLARGTTDTAQRAALYGKALQVVRHERPWIMLAHAPVYIPVTRDVQGFLMSPNGGVNFEDVWKK